MAKLNSTTTTTDTDTFEYDIANNIPFIDNTVIPLDTTETLLDIHYLTHMQLLYYQHRGNSERVAKLKELESVLEENLTCM